MPNIERFAIVCKTCGGGPTNLTVGLVFPNFQQINITCINCRITETHNLPVAPFFQQVPHFVEESNVVEKEAEPVEPEPKTTLSPKAKLMQILIEKKELKTLEKNKKKLNEQEYLYVKEIIERSLQA